MAARLIVVVPADDGAVSPMTMAIVAISMAPPDLLNDLFASLGLGRFTRLNGGQWRSLGSNNASIQRHEAAHYRSNHRSFHAYILPFSELYLL
jgi:hypothetical protein